MTRTLGRRCGGLGALLLVGALVAGALPARADGPVALGRVGAFGGAGEHAPLYAATAAGLYRTTAPPYGAWTQQNGTPGIVALSVNPTAAGTLVYATASAIYRGTDGGVTATVVKTVAGVSSLTRAPSTPTTIYAVAAPTYNSGDLLKSVDDGRTWTMVYAPDQAAVTSVVVSPSTPNEVLIGLRVYHGGGVAQSSDGGLTFKDAGDAGMPLAGVDVVAINPRRPGERWASWSLMGYGQLDHSTDGGQTWHRVAGGWPANAAATDLGFDSLTGRLYVAVSNAAAPASVWASADGQRFERFAPGAADLGSRLRVLAADGYLLSGDGAHSLSAWRLISPGAWPVAAPFTAYYAAVNAPRLLGQPIGPLARCGGLPCQYFQKGRLEDHSTTTTNRNWRIAFGAVVGELVTGQSTLAVGGDGSTLTYRALHSFVGLAGQTAAPAGYHGGVAVRHDGSAFISLPGSTTAGHIVPAYFWAYLTNHATTPGGWLHDLGLPITPALKATVSKGGLGLRTVYIQAFQFAVLTYDAANPPAWRVERANAGSDNAAAYPAAAR